MFLHKKYVWEVRIRKKEVEVQEDKAKSWLPFTDVTPETRGAPRGKRLAIVYQLSDFPGSRFGL